MKERDIKPSRDQAELLLRKAAQDQFIVDVHVSDDACPIEVYGFHAQQAVGKMLKAVLALRGVDYPYTHLLDTLVDLVAPLEPSVRAFDDLRLLTPFGAQLRYDEIPIDKMLAIDRPTIRQRIADLKKWTQAIVEVR